MKISVTKALLVIQFIFILLANVCNYLAIGEYQWRSNVIVWNSNNSQVVIGFIAAGTALNILSFIIALLSVLSICIKKFRDSFALYFIIGTLVTSLLSLILNVVGWCESISFSKPEKTNWNFWILAASFGCTVAACLALSMLIGFFFASNKLRHTESTGQSKESNYQMTQRNPTSSTPAQNQPEYYVYQNEFVFQNESTLRL